MTIVIDRQHLSVVEHRLLAGEDEATISAHELDVVVHLQVFVINTALPEGFFADRALVRTLSCQHTTTIQ